MTRIKLIGYITSVVATIILVVYIIDLMPSETSWLALKRDQDVIFLLILYQFVVLSFTSMLFYFLMEKKKITNRLITVTATTNMDQIGEVKSAEAEPNTKIIWSLNATIVFLLSGLSWLVAHIYGFDIGANFWELTAKTILLYMLFVTINLGTYLVDTAE